jgi:aryl-alcohol dehydrogenase-like predicted oxidoreductase
VRDRSSSPLGAERLDLPAQITAGRVVVGRRRPHELDRSAIANDFRAHLPRFTGDNRVQNQQLVDALHEVAAARGVSPAQLAIAWARAKKPYVIPTVGARTRKQLDDALGALAITLTPAEIAELETVVPANAVAGTRYAEPLMQHLDSER